MSSGSAEQPEATAQSIDRLAEARAILEKEYLRGPRLDELARVARCSTFHFHRRFRKQYGTTPKQMILKLKIQYVQRLMLKGTPLKEVARAAAFSHHSHMATIFKQIVGTTPTAWLRHSTHRK